MAEGEEVEEAGGALLPGAGEGGVELDFYGTAEAVDLDETVEVGLAWVEAAALEQVADEEDERLMEEAGVLPETVAAVDGGSGGEAGGEQVPGQVEAELPEQGVEQEAVVEGRAAAGSPGRDQGKLRRGREEGGEEGVLGVGEEGVHGRRVIRYQLSVISGQ